MPSPLLFPLILLLLLPPPLHSQAINANCDPATYYSSLTSSDLDGTTDPATLLATLQSLISTTHTNVIPYTSTAVDCWNALEVLDASTTSGLEATHVQLIYKLTDEPFTTQGGSAGWNREHVWPKSYGVGYDGPDTSDLHSLRAADWSVNSSRSNRYYDWCNATTGGCTTPAHWEAAVDTGKKSISGELGLFMPPASVRGDLARSIFYMATRYDGSETNTENLMISDCPCLSTYTMGKLSALIAWHNQDPPDAAEVARTAGKRYTQAPYTSATHKRHPQAPPTSATHKRHTQAPHTSASHKRHTQALRVSNTPPPRSLRGLPGEQEPVRGLPGSGAACVRGD